jgi:hypothetical protein
VLGLIRSHLIEVHVFRERHLARMDRENAALGREVRHRELDLPVDAPRVLGLGN